MLFVSCSNCAYDSAIPKYVSHRQREEIQPSFPNSSWHGHLDRDLKTVRLAARWQVNGRSRTHHTTSKGKEGKSDGHRCPGLHVISVSLRAIQARLLIERTEREWSPRAVGRRPSDAGVVSNAQVPQGKFVVQSI